MVTATRREESLSKIPVSVTALTPADVTNYALRQPGGAATVQENDYTFRPRTIGISATWHVHGH